MQQLLQLQANAVNPAIKIFAETVDDDARRPSIGDLGACDSFLNFSTEKQSCEKKAALPDSQSESRKTDE